MRDEDFDFAAFAESLLDAVIFADDAGRITYINSAAQSMFGYTSDALVSQDLAILMPERFRADHHRGLERIRSGSKPIYRGVPLELTGLRQNGDEFPIELSLSSWRSERGYIFSGVIRDVSGRRRFERRQKTQLAVTRLIADSSSLMEAVTRVIETICESMDWELGVMWVHDPRTDTLRCAHFWDSQAPRQSAFERATVNARFARGEGLPGAVWATGTPKWIKNVTSSAGYIRAATASDLGLRTALAFPILNSKEMTVGVLEFTTRELREPDAALLEMVDGIGRQIGTLIERAYSTEAVQNTIEQMQVGVLVFQLEALFDDHSLRLISLNPAASEILNIPADQMIGRLIDENFPNLRERGIPEMYRRVVETQHSVELEDISYNDERVALAAFAVKAFPLPNRCVGVAFENITKRKSAEQLIRAERKILEEIAREGTSLGDVLTSITNFSDAQTAGTFSSILLVTDGGDKLTYAAAPGLPKDFLDATAIVDVEDSSAPSSLAVTLRRTVAVASIQNDDRSRSIRAAALANNFVACMATPIITRAGEVIGTMTALSTAGHAPTERESEVIEFAARMAAIVIERHLAQQVLRESEERFDVFMKNAPLMAFIKDSLSRYVWINEEFEKVLSLPLGDIVGKSDFEIFDQATAEQNVANDLQVLLSERPLESSLTMTTADKVERSWLSVKFPLQMSSGARQIGGIAIDLTERNSLAERLESAERVSGLGRLAANIAHEINNVLMGILPFSEVIRRQAGENPALQTAAGHIARSIDRGRRITQDILGYARAAPPVTRSFNARAWLMEVTTDLQAMLGEDIILKVDLPDESVFLQGDPLQLQQVLVNLGLNSRDAMDGKGVIAIRAGESSTEDRPFGVARPDRFLRLSIEDTGAGIPAHVIGRIFEPLFSTKGKGGTGLGLAIVHQVIAMHGGEIQVDSTPGAGTAFDLHLPIASSPSRASSPARGPAPDVSRVVLVEDDQSVGSGICALLEGDGIHVRWVLTGGEAALAVASFHPDVLILDVGLPDMNGFDVYRILRTHFPALPTIFSTGHGELSLVAQFDDAPVLHLQKPYDYETLLQAITAVIKLSGDR